MVSRWAAWPTQRLLEGSIPKVSLYHATGCHLCERALAQVRALREELEFELEEVAIDGSPELEERYRELIPVVEIDGERVFTYYVHEDAFRRRLGTAQTGVQRPSL
ncbi:MAG TPA: glutaredoxin family protein [Gaiellaceae bacterium]